jgi:hypothetical protein
MQTQASRRFTTKHQDERVQSAVLGLVLYEHPIQLTSEDLRREVGDDDATDRAIGELVAVGLLRRERESILPTRAALHFDCLEMP